ncbi:carbohydrate-binding protein [Amycolatopsis sp. YIM 10]|uniref:carbohydrate-binding protein n=1 Tax=Amycolatopsis sp. YIM 10 TaxID=2653857 RepID=UPI0012902493|nr:carbohydrate-binding protein [Amycolatopsis sp. YIM 10]QFU88345.1 Pectate disaccharide-lyase precursor [Amycolatopsis sp. YIM 10]
MRLTLLAASTALAAGAALVLPLATANAATTHHEAESAPTVCTGTVDTNWPGYSGSGFCNGENATGAYVEFAASAPSAGNATVAVRFANGTTASRAADLLVNGTKVQSVSFESTGAWSTWVTKTLTVALPAGAGTIRLDPTTSGGLPNIDYADVTTSGTGPQPADALYVSPTGQDGATGTIGDPTTLTSALTRVAAGGTIYLRGGTYDFSQTVTIPPGNSGTSGALKKLSAYQAEKPVLNFSAQSEDPANRGLAVNGSYWHVYGVTVERAGDNGIFVGGSNNTFERTVTRFNRDTGLQLSRMTSDTPKAQWPANNLVLSAESHDNADSDGEDADGFAAKLTSGPGNVFRYAVAHNNIDDGWDLYTKTDTGAIGTVTIEDSLAYKNGTLSNGGQAGNGDRNGYKLGGEDIAVDHTIRRSIAFDNGKHGFTFNRNPGSMTMSNNLSIDNDQRNYTFEAGSTVFRDNTSCRSSSGTNDKVVGNTDSSNQFWMGSNGSRCGSYSGALGWSFGADGRLAVTLGGKPVVL